jgi:G3E family GTPase
VTLLRGYRSRCSQAFSAWVKPRSSTTFCAIAKGKRVAVIVNDMSEVNIDAGLVWDGGAKLSRTEEKLVEFSNGCICCMLRDDLLAEVQRLAGEDRFDTS